MKKILLTLALTISALITFSQESQVAKFSVGVLGALPGDGLTEDYTHAVGGIGQMICRPTKSISYVLTTGYIVHVGKRNVEMMSQVPALVGLRYNVGPAYAGITVGASLYNKGIGWRYTTVPSVGLQIRNVNAEVLYSISTVDHLHSNLSIIGLALSYYF